MRRLVNDVAVASTVLGHQSFNFSERELANLQFKRSIYASKNISQGEPFAAAKIKLLFERGHPIDLKQNQIRGHLNHSTVVKKARMRNISDYLGKQIDKSPAFHKRVD